MTRERAKELLPIIIGISEGKTIQFWNNNIWEDTPVPSLTHEAKRYRIKPEPKYRPFKNAKEFEPYRDRWIKLTLNNKIHWKVIVGYDDEGITFIMGSNICYRYYIDMMFTEFTFDDGKPIGKLIDEVQDDKI